MSGTSSMTMPPIPTAPSSSKPSPTASESDADMIDVAPDAPQAPMSRRESTSAPGRTRSPSVSASQFVATEDAMDEFHAEWDIQKTIPIPSEAPILLNEADQEHLDAYNNPEELTEQELKGTGGREAKVDAQTGYIATLMLLHFVKSLPEEDKVVWDRVKPYIASQAPQFEVVRWGAIPPPKSGRVPKHFPDIHDHGACYRDVQATPDVGTVYVLGTRDGTTPAVMPLGVYAENKAPGVMNQAPVVVKTRTLPKACGQAFLQALYTATWMLKRGSWALGQAKMNFFAIVFDTQSLWTVDTPVPREMALAVGNPEVQPAKRTEVIAQEYTLAGAPWYEAYANVYLKQLKEAFAELKAVVAEGKGQLVLEPPSPLIYSSAEVAAAAAAQRPKIASPPGSPGNSRRDKKRNRTEVGEGGPSGTRD